MNPLDPVAVAPFSNLPMPTTVESGVRISQRDGLGIATLLARRAGRGALAARMRERLGIELPRGPSRTNAGTLSIVGIGPATWLAISERDGNAFAGALREAAGELASVCDQSDGFAVLRLSSPRVREALAKLVPIDLHERAFHVGDAAVTAAGHVGATLWRLEDAGDGSATFEIAVYRSYAAGFWHELVESAAEFGIVEER